MSNGNVRMVTTAIKSRFNKDTFEQEAWQNNRVVVGIDEVGRGCLAGPVVTAAVILHPNKKSRLVKDSKLLTPEEHLKAYRWITKNSWFSIGIMHHRCIDQHNIYQATLKAMQRSLMQLLHSCPLVPSKILIDAMPLRLHHTPFNELEVLHFIKGEQRSSSIAAASIVAKVKRDHIMRVMNASLPGYQLDSHKGYSTQKHKEKIQELQHSIIHRMSFLEGKIYFCDTPTAEQISFIALHNQELQLQD